MSRHPVIPDALAAPTFVGYTSREDADEARNEQARLGRAAMIAGPAAVAEISKRNFDEAICALVDLIHHRKKITDDPHKTYVVLTFTREDWAAARDAMEMLRLLGFGPRPTGIPRSKPHPAVMIDGVKYVPEGS